MSPATEAPGVDREVAEALRAEIAELVSVTEEIRGLQFLEEPSITVLSEQELAARIRADLESELEPDELETTQAWFQLLGLLPNDAPPLLDVYVNLLGEQVIGLYDLDTKELLVRGETAELSPLSRSTVVHELLHALADQHFDDGTALETLVDGERYDEASAFFSFLEGEATYFQLLYITERLSTSESLALATEALDQDTSALDATPYVISEPFFYRYEAGLDFVTAVAADGGIDALNQAHVIPPTTTEHISHPETYLEGEGADDVALPTTAVAGYEVVEESTWGELGLLATFGQLIGPGAASQIGDGWGGDAYRIMTSGDEVLFVLTYRGDTERDAEEVAEALADLAAAMDAGEGETADDASVTFSGEDYAFVDRDGATVVFVAATDPEAGATAAGVVDLGNA